jgi:hypothetical protein
MGTTLTPDNIPPQRPAAFPPGHDVKSLGPSDSSDSGSDMAGPGLIDADMLNLDRGTSEDMEGGDDDLANAGGSVGDIGMDEDSDRNGTGTRTSADLEPRGGDASDIGPDRIVSAAEAGLGGGLDQAEEAQLGITDEELLGDESSDSRPPRAPRPTGRT